MKKRVEIPSFRLTAYFYARYLIVACLTNVRLNQLFENSI